MPGHIRAGGRNPGGSGYGQQANIPPYGFPYPGYAIPPESARNNPRNIPNTRPLTGPRNFPPLPIPRSQAPGPVGMGWGVAGMAPEIGAVNVARQAAGYQAYGTQGANVQNPLFGRPGFSYQVTRPATRIGPVAKTAPGTGLTATGADRSRGFVPAGHITEQYMPVNQFDYQPPTRGDYSYDVPKSIGVGDDGVQLVSTYRAHDFVPAQRFFNQARSSQFWQDQTFGPNYRMLQAVQLVARYNLYNSIALAQPLSAQNYFLGYQMQQPMAAQMGGINGIARPLGYG